MMASITETHVIPQLSLVVPVLNEEEAIPLFLERVRPILNGISTEWEVIFVNDGSTDRTLETLRQAHVGDPRIKVIDFSRNFGKEIALTAGIDHSRGRAVIPLDVDLQDPPELIVDMVAKWREGFDVVLAVRKDRSSDNWAKRHTASMFYRVMGRMSTVTLPPNVGDFRLMDRRVVAILGQYRERQRFMKGLFASLGFKQAVVEYVRPERSAGNTKFHPLRLWGLALEGIISFSTTPLKIWTYIGVLCAAFSTVYMLWLIGRTLILGNPVPGYASLMTVVLFMNGMMLTGLGVIGEYIARIFSEVKARPIYIVREQIGLESSTDDQGRERA